MKGFSIFLIALGLIVPTVTVIQNIQFQQDCSGYLKQAADANSVELALERLNKAIEYIEKNKLTAGYTSILWKTEDDNVEFWYRNLKTCQQELNDAIDAPQFEKTNVLMKVRESLTDNDGEQGTVLNLPKGISRYPSNSGFALGNTISVIAITIALGILFA